MLKPIDHLPSCSNYCMTAAGETPQGHGKEREEERWRQGEGEGGQRRKEGIERRKESKKKEMVTEPCHVLKVN